MTNILLNKLERMESLPTREGIRASFYEHRYDEVFKKSANKSWKIARNYLKRTLKKSSGKTLKEVVDQLQQKPQYVHNKAFSHAIRCCVESYVVSREDYPARLVYLDPSNIIREIKEDPNLKPFVPYVAPKDTVDNIRLFKLIVNKEVKYLLREKGIHYFIPFKVYHEVFNTYGYYNKDTVFVSSKTQLNKTELRKHNLKNMWEY